MFIDGPNDQMMCPPWVYFCNFDVKKSQRFIGNFVSGGSKGGRALGNSRSDFFQISCSFQEKMPKLIGLRPHIWLGLTLHLWEPPLFMNFIRYFQNISVWYLVWCVCGGDVDTNLPETSAMVDAVLCWTTPLHIFSSGSSEWVRGARNMKSMRPPSVAIFMTFFKRTRWARPLVRPDPLPHLWWWIFHFH